MRHEDWKFTSTFVDRQIPVVVMMPTYYTVGYRCVMPRPAAILHCGLRLSCLWRLSAEKGGYKWMFVAAIDNSRG